MLLEGIAAMTVTYGRESRAAVCALKMGRKDHLASKEGGIRSSSVVVRRAGFGGDRWLRRAMLWLPGVEEVAAARKERKFGRKSSSRVIPADALAFRSGLVLESRFESKDSKLGLTRESLRKRLKRTTTVASLPWQVLLCVALVTCCLISPAECNDGRSGALEPLLSRSTSNLTLSDLISDEIRSLIPDQDCVFPYFRRYTGACVSHRHVNGVSFYYHVPDFTTGYVVLIHGAGVGRSEDCECSNPKLKGWVSCIRRVDLWTDFFPSDLLSLLAYHAFLQGSFASTGFP